MAGHLSKLLNKFLKERNEMNKIQLIEKLRSESDYLSGREEQAVLKIMQANLEGKAKAQEFVTEVLKNDYDQDEKNNYEASYLWHSFESAHCYGFELHHATLNLILAELIKAKAQYKAETLAGATRSEEAPKLPKKQGGYAKKAVLAVLAFGASIALTGCNALDTYKCETGGKLNFELHNAVTYGGA